MVSSLKSPPGGHSAGWPPQMFFGFWQWSCFRKSKNVGTSKFWDGGSILKLTIRLRLKMSELWDVPDLTELAAIWADLMQLILPLKTQPQLFRQLEFRLIVALISRHQHLSLKLSSATRSKMLEISWNASRSKGFFVHSGDPTKTLWHIINSWPYQHQPGTICVVWDVWDHILAGHRLGTGNVRTSSPPFSLAHGCST